jgi:hypothetical protein
MNPGVVSRRAGVNVAVAVLIVAVRIVRVRLEPCARIVERLQIRCWSGITRSRNKARQKQDEKDGRP